MSTCIRSVCRSLPSRSLSLSRLSSLSLSSSTSLSSPLFSSLPTFSSPSSQLQHIQAWIKCPSSSFSSYVAAAASSTSNPPPSPLSSAPSTQSSSSSSAEADTGLGSESNLQSNVFSPLPPPGTVKVELEGEMYSSPPRDLKQDWVMPHALWHDAYTHQVEYTHFVPKDTVDYLALWTIRAIRFNFDWMSGYSFGPLTEKKAITRMVFLETVAGVPGSIAGTLRHLASLRRMKRDGGWIHTLMEEAENERMHLLTALAVRQPKTFMKMMVWLTQGLFFNFYWFAYLVSPRFCHRLVGFLEEEAVVTYTKMLKEIDSGNLKGWATKPAPALSIKYWALPENATMRDVIKHIRADEAHHRDVNHKLAGLKPSELNPYRHTV